MGLHRDREIKVRFTQHELDMVHAKMAQMGYQNREAYMRKMGIDGYCVRLDLPEIRELTRLVKICSNNLNQYAHRANADGSIYAEDIKDLQRSMEKIYDLEKLILRRLATIR